MLKVGVTGGIGSGKTLVCSVFKSIGIPVYNADIEAKKISNTDAETISKVKTAFGDDIYNNKGIDRKKLASIIFTDEDALKKINAIIHPKVRVDFKIWCKQYNHLPYVIQEAAILYESGAYKELDFTINVSASEETRIERVMHRDNTTFEQVKERMKNQLNDQERLRLADFNIINDENSMILPQILEIHKKLIRLKE
ncbi:MAG: dephospho-CoA kinase [Bacteroidetes bacterium GWF2_33_16]|nr:MAG: dephospho-CoA kinase [Bacteroidetes bacterium GWE2_32_14]OFY05889.1 MAG: dephospho-CoA kinase [Bacteroidetes bacterium GWF2_33_16]